jgi:copper chaperone NosL
VRFGRLLRAAALALGAFVVVVVAWPGAKAGPEPVAWGRDACGQCRMLLSRPGFAAELRDASGVLTRYDDVGCLVRAMRAAHADVPEVWVEDHAGGGFVPLLTARLVRAPSVATPMGSGIVAFRDDGAAREFAAAQRGALVTLEDLLREPVRDGREER